MELPPFLLDQWLSLATEREVTFHLGGSTDPQWTLGELLALDGDNALARLLSSDVAYGLTAGRRDLREAIADMHRVPTEHVLVVNGGSEALLHLFFLAARPGANVVVPFPGFPPYQAIPASLGVEVRVYHLRREHRHRLDPDEVMRLVDADTTLVLVNSPHNPTGTVPTDAEMRMLHDFLVDRGVQFACDEVFHPIYHGHDRASASSLPGATVIGDASKALSLPGLRIGWLVEPDDRRRGQYLNAREYFSISNAVVGEYFAEIAIRHRDEILGRTREVAQRNLAHLERLVDEHAETLEWVRPEGGMTAFIRLCGGEDARPLCEAALADGLLITPGDCFGVPDHFRLGFGAERERFPEAMACLRKTLTRWTRAGARAPA